MVLSKLKLVQQHQKDKVINMAKFVANYTFKGKKEMQEFPKDEEFEMTIKRAEEIEKNIQNQKGFEEFKMTRIDEPNKETKED